MKTKRPQQAARQVKRTALLAGEGKAEVKFLNHLKALYLERGSKAVSVKDAKGKGGRAVLNYVLRQGKAIAYDELAVLLDTDADWSDAQRALAKRSSVSVFEAQPCLEALLLGIAGASAPSLTADCKSAFKKRYSCEAHEVDYHRHFSQQVLDLARARNRLLDRLIQFLTD